MDTAQSELDRANTKLDRLEDRLEALRDGAAERYQGERNTLEGQETYWLEERKKWGDALLAASTQPGNDFVTRAFGT